MTKLTGMILWPHHKPAHTLVDPWAFAIALIAGPVIPGILGAPLLLVPTVGVVLGAAPYLLIGAPVLWAAIRRGLEDPGQFAYIGFILNAIGGLILAALYLGLTAYTQGVHRMQGDLTGVMILWALAMVHGAVWCSIFASVYRRLRNPNFPKTV